MKMIIYKGDYFIIEYYVEKYLDKEVKSELIGKGIDTFNFECGIQYNIKGYEITNAKLKVYINGYNESQTNIILEIYKNKLGITSNFIPQKNYFELNLYTEELNKLFEFISTKVENFKDLFSYE